MNLIDEHLLLCIQVISTFGFNKTAKSLILIGIFINVFSLKKVLKKQ